MITASGGLDWGTVPAWVGSILTGGSLLLGFYILLRDRRNSERAQAELVGTHRIDTAGPGEHRETVLFVHNGSDGVINDATFSALPRVPRERLQPVSANLIQARASPVVRSGIHHKDFWQVAPGERLEFKLGLSGDHEDFWFLFSFKDARGRKWSLDTDANILRLMQPGVRTRLLRRFRNQR